MSATTCLAKTGDAGIKDAQPMTVVPELGLSVFVVFTTTTRTLKALERACEMAKPLGADIHVVAVQVVPYPLPLSQPPVPFEFVLRRFRDRTAELPGQIQVTAFLCRDSLQALKCGLPPDSPIFIGVGRSWLPDRDRRLAWRLRRAGYEVIQVRSE